MRSALPRLRQAGFIDALMQSLLMLREMEVDVPEEDRYLVWLRSRIKPDGSICCFDRPGCVSDRHATSQLLEFLRVFPVSE
jgi:cell division FtsZ-interacting protein ZapD